MSTNRLDAGASLLVVPDTFNKAYEFYIWQVVTFTATLAVPGGCADGQIVIFENVGTQHQTFALYGSPSKDTTKNSEYLAWQVVARSQDADPSVATATIRAIYNSTTVAHASFIAKAIVAGVEVPASYAYTVVAPSVSIERSIYPYQLQLAFGEYDTPLSSCGNYFVCRAYISDLITGSSLRNMNFRLSPPEGQSFAGVKCYPALNSAAKDVLSVDEDQGWVEVLTDADGVADVYVCAAKTFGNYAGVIYGKCGIVEELVSAFVMPDFNSALSTLEGPQLLSDLVQVPPGDTVDKIDCKIPGYTNNAGGDRIFVLCNRRAQRVGDPSLTRTGPGPVDASFSKFGLHNLTFDDNRYNELAYIVLPANEPASLSTALRFYSTGDPGTPARRLYDGIEKAPTIVEALGHGVVINTKTIGNGLTIRVPIVDNNPDDSWHGVRYVVNVMLEVSGWMASTDPMATLIINPLGREVSKPDIARGYVDIWFPSIELWGFGQSAEGLMGRCNVQYIISPFTSFPSSLEEVFQRQNDSSDWQYSKILHCHIDTLPPSGVGAYFDLAGA